MNRGENLFRVAKCLMIIGGTWRLKLNELSEQGQRMYTIYSILIQIAYSSCLVSFVVKFYGLYGVDNDKAVECLSMLTVVFLFSTKTFLCQTKKIKELLTRAIDDINRNSLDNDVYIEKLFTSHSRYTMILNIFITVYGFSLGIHLNVIGFMESRQFERQYHNLTETPDKPLLVIYWYPFDYNKHYKIVQCYQLFTVLFSDLYNSGVQSLLNTILIQLSVQLKILQHRCRNFTIDIVTGREVTKRIALKKLKDLAKKYLDLIKYCKDLNECLKIPILIEYTVSSLMLASILVQILSNKKVLFNTQYFLILAFQLFMLSWNSNEIIIQSQGLLLALYQSRWYNQSKETKQIMQIMMLRSRKPLTVDIGPFGPLTNNAALSRLKLAYSYVSLISGNNM